MTEQSSLKHSGKSTPTHQAGDISGLRSGFQSAVHHT
jgi:hypothetical protein